MVFSTYITEEVEELAQKNEILGNMEKYKDEYSQFKQLADSAKPWENTSNTMLNSWKSLKGNFVIIIHNVRE